MEIVFTTEASADLEYWKKSGNVKIQKKISQLLTAIKESPFSGVGKPEALKHELSGYWSRRITIEHRLVYTVKSTTIEVISLRFHY